MSDDTTRGERDPRTPEDAGLPPWDERTELYAGGVSAPRFSNLPVPMRLRALARAWLGELRRVGLSGGRKTAREADYPPEHQDGPFTRPVRFENGETVWLRFGAYRDERGFLRTEVLGTPPRTDRAILAALSVLEGGGGDPDKVREGLTVKRKWDDVGERWVWRYGRLDGPEERLLLCADNLLLEYRPGFRELPEVEQRELRIKACKHVAAVASEARKLHNFLEFGKAYRRTRNAIEDAQTDVYAAELHHLVGMSQQDVARELHRTISERNKVKGGQDTAGSMIARGTELLQQPLGRQGWLRLSRPEDGGSEGSPPPDF